MRQLSSAIGALLICACPQAAQPMTECTWTNNSGILTNLVGEDLIPGGNASPKVCDDICKANTMSAFYNQLRDYPCKAWTYNFLNSPGYINGVNTMGTGSGFASAVSDVCALHSWPDNLTGVVPEFFSGPDFGDGNPTGGRYVCSAMPIPPMPDVATGTPDGVTASQSKSSPPDVVSALPSKPSPSDASQPSPSDVATAPPSKPSPSDASQPSPSDVATAPPSKPSPSDVVTAPPSKPSSSDGSSSPAASSAPGPSSPYMAILIT
jgi:hypothetical protein